MLDTEQGGAVPRSSREQQAAHHDEILHSAARLIRERGVEGFSVPEVMKAAGLTHGGFYKHFSSKEDLLVQAESAAFAARLAGLQDITARSDSAAAARAEFVANYLSPSHRDNPGAGCPTAALAADAARSEAGTPIRGAFVDGVKAMLAALEQGRQDTDPPAAAELATLVGAVLLARATAGDEVSDQFLSAARVLLAGGPGDTVSTSEVRAR